MIARITPNYISNLRDNEVFVFGSNREGRHGKGAALEACKKFGAIYSQARGIQGQSYAIVTKELRYWLKNPVTTSQIGIEVEAFIAFAKDYPNKIFLVTEIGCNLAGFTPEQIAPLFKNAINILNIYLPKSFWAILINIQ